MGSILVGRCTNHLSRDFTGDWDVHWGYGILTHGQIWRDPLTMGRGVPGLVNPNGYRHKATQPKKLCD